MVYCRLLSKENNSISYAIGALYNDITGIIKFEPSGKSYDIIKQPQREEVYPYFIDKMIAKYQTLIDQGNFPDKMSYEI